MLNNQGVRIIIYPQEAAGCDGRIKKNGKYGAFYVCSNYTKGCRYTRDI